MGEFLYGVLGAGRQGTAAAYDLIARGRADAVVLADLDGVRAEESARRVNRLVDDDPAVGIALDVRDEDSIALFLSDKEGAISAVPYKLNLAITRAALRARTHLCDLGGHTGTVRDQLAMNEAAVAAGIGVVPDCGQVPGTGANLLAWMINQFDEAEEAILYDGGIPTRPKAPWNYELTFHIDGLTNEYYGHARYVIDGEVVEVECFDESEYELIDFGPPYGELEAFVTAGGLSTAADSLSRRVRTLKNKTIRYPGHVAQFKAFRDAGFFEEGPIKVGDVEVVPREVYHALIEPKIRATEATRDVVLNRAVGTGTKDGRRIRVTLDVQTHYGDSLGFTAMEQATGWHAAIVCHMLVTGEINPGVHGVELAVDPDRLLEEFRRRGFLVEHTLEFLD